MILLENLIGKDVELTSLPIEHQDNLLLLLNCINQVQVICPYTFIVTSGYRTRQHHINIYTAKGITDLKLIPWGSKHLIGAAVDIYDSQKDIQNWCFKNQRILAGIGLWLEEFASEEYPKGTTNWVHFQCKPYGSWKPGKSIFFRPF